MDCLLSVMVRSSSIHVLLGNDMFGRWGEGVELPHVCRQFRNDCTIAFPTTGLFACTLVEYLKEYIWKKRQNEDHRRSQRTDLHITFLSD